jgi:hypothetical protein
MRLFSTVLWTGIAAIVPACGGSDWQEEALEVPAREEFGTVVSDIRWAAPTPLINEHVNWHRQPCGRNGGRSCTNQGADFLDFHEDYLARLRAAGWRAGLTDDQTSGWQTVPSIIRSTPAWSDASSRALRRLNSASLDTFCGIAPDYNSFGSYIERNLHGAIHVGAAQAMQCPPRSTGGDCIIRNFMSPASTLFFRIHGLINIWRSRYLNNCL